RFFDQMCAVEQQLARLRGARGARELAKSLDDRVLATRDPLHLLALGAAAARRFPPAPRYARFIARPLRRPLHSPRGALGARGRRCAAVLSAPPLRSLHCAAASPAAPFR